MNDYTRLVAIRGSVALFVKPDADENLLQTMGVIRDRKTGEIRGEPTLVQSILKWGYWRPYEPPKEGILAQVNRLIALAKRRFGKPDA